MKFGAFHTKDHFARIVRPVFRDFIVLKPETYTWKCGREWSGSANLLPELVWKTELYLEQI